MKSQDTSTSLKNWPCYLEKIHEDATRIVYVDDFNGSKIFIHVQRDGYVTIQADNDTIINDYIETIPHPGTLAITKYGRGEINKVLALLSEPLRNSPKGKALEKRLNSIPDKE